VELAELAELAKLEAGRLYPLKSRFYWTRARPLP